MQEHLPGAVRANLAEGFPEPSGYDAVILGSGIWFGKIGKPLRQYLTQYWEVLKEMDKAVFICHALPEETREILRANFSLQMRNSCILVESLGGELDPSRLSAVDRLRLKARKPQLLQMVREGLVPAIDVAKALEFAKTFRDTVDPPEVVFDQKTRRLVEVRQ